MLCRLVDAAEGLVEDHDARILRQRTSDENAPPLPAAELADLPCRQPIQTEMLQNIAHDIAVVFARHAKPPHMPAAPHQNDIKHRSRESPVDGVLLRHISDIAVAAVTVFAINRELAARRIQQADDDLEERALARAVGSYNRDAFARLHREADIMAGRAGCRDNPPTTAAHPMPANRD